jgi:uncharacterized membrane protein YgaE (UPF0421/DUF939 family)
MTEAAERSRVQARERSRRLMRTGRALVQNGSAAIAAWLIATEIVGHQRPFFAPVAAIITLGLTFGQRGRRALELAVGVPLGIAVADLLVLEIGTGAWQLGFVVVVATAVALLLGSGQLLAAQAAVSAALVATLQPPTDGISFARAVDALVGAGVALAVNALVFPIDPRALAGRAAHAVLDELAGTLEDIAAALAARDRKRADRALARARGVDELGADFIEAAEIGRETARMAPFRRGDLERIGGYARAAEQVDFAVRNVRVLARGTIRAVRLGENVPPELAEAVRDLAAAVRALEPALALGDDDAEEVVREHALRAAARATLVLERTGNLSVSVIVGQVRSTAVDLLRGAGMTYEEAAEAVREAARESEADAALLD